MPQAPLIDTHSVIGPTECRRMLGIPEPPSEDALWLSFTVTCRPCDERSVKDSAIAGLQALGLVVCHYRREPCRG